MKVLKRADINEAGQATIEAFNGHNDIGFVSAKQI